MTDNRHLRVWLVHTVEVHDIYWNSVGLRGFLCQAEDGIRDLVRSRGLGDVYKRQQFDRFCGELAATALAQRSPDILFAELQRRHLFLICLLYTSDAADERSSVDLGGRRIIKKKTRGRTTWSRGGSSTNIVHSSTSRAQTTRQVRGVIIEQ